MIKLNKSTIFTVLLIVLLIVFYFLSKIENKFDKIPGNCNPVKVDKCFVLTLPDSKEKLTQFLDSYKSNIPLEIIYSFNTKNKSEAEKYKHLVDPERYNLMYDFDSGTKIRPDHTYFNSGALGCYLGHMKIYEKCFEQKLDYAIIFEDNVVLSESFNNELNSALSRLGDDFDACFLHCSSNVGEYVEKCGSMIKKLKWITSTKCYLINVNRMKKYYELFYPIFTSVDIAYEKLIRHGADVYLINFNSIKLGIKKSAIGHTKVLSNNRFLYLDQSENRNIKICDLRNF
jgi:GR25 family glycosyltransferase involved in LPS biosynthesis